MDVRIRNIAVTAAIALSAAALAACGSLNTAAVSSTPNAAQATATAAFNHLNAIQASHGEPTYAAGTDPLHPTAKITYPPEDLTPAPTATFGPPPCGVGLTNGLAVVSQYGPPTKGACGVIKDGLLFLETRGVGDGPGAIAIYQCTRDDENCLHNKGPVENPGSWSVYPAPAPGPVTTLAFEPPDSVIVSTGAGQLCFNLTTREYDASYTIPGGCDK